MDYKKVGENMYDGAAEIGRVTSTVGIIFASIFLGLMFIAGIVLVVKGNIKSKTKPLDKASEQLDEGLNLSSRLTGYILIGVSLIFGIVTAVYYYVVMKYKPIAALEGVEFVEEMFKF